MKLNELKNNLGSKKKGKRLGRGIGSGLGKTSGKGHKGQKARSGVAIKSFEGGQTSIVKRFPKRGFNSLKKEFRPIIVSLSQINDVVVKNNIQPNHLLDRNALVEFGIIGKNDKNKVKVLSGDITVALNFNLDLYSEEAKKRIESVGGKIEA